MDNILFDEPVPGIVRITLNRPEKLNSFTFPMYEACAKRWVFHSRRVVTQPRKRRS